MFPGLLPTIGPLIMIILSEDSECSNVCLRQILFLDQVKKKPGKLVRTVKTLILACL